MRPQIRFSAARSAQRGVVLLFAMIALVILLIGTAALMRSMNTSMFTAGNFGFKRDLTNQGERAMDTVLDLVRTGGTLESEAARDAHAKANNYRASMLATNGQGLPLALLSDGEFDKVGVAGNDIQPAGMGVTVRYVIDRLCTADGPASPDSCTVADSEPQGVSAGETPPPTVPRPVYRVSIRVDGPRNTQSFFQSTFTI